MARKGKTEIGKRAADEAGATTRPRLNKPRGEAVPSARKKQARPTSEAVTLPTANRPLVPIVGPEVLERLTLPTGITLGDVGTRLFESRERFSAALGPFSDPAFVERLGDLTERATATSRIFSTAFQSPAREALDAIGTPRPEVKPANSGRQPPAPEKGLAIGRPIASTADIGIEVRNARRAMGMTQQRFADLAGVGRRFLIELEQGKPTLEIGRVLVVCRAAGIKLGFLA